MFNAVLTVLYTLAGIAACLCYLPQLHLLLRDAEARRAMSLLSWGGWFGGSGITALYAMVVVAEPEMVAVAGLNWLCQGAVFGLAVRQRFVDRHGIVTPPSTPRKDPSARVVVRRNAITRSHGHDGHQCRRNGNRPPPA